MSPRVWTRLAWAWIAAAAPLGAALPDEVTVSAPAKLEILNAGKPSGSVGVRPGEKLAVVDAAAPYVIVRYRNLSGRILASQTDFPPERFPAAPASAPTVPPPATPAESVATPTAVVPAPAAPVVAEEPAPVPSAFEKTIGGPLMAMQAGSLRPVSPGRLAGGKFFAIYFSASWCGPCRAFTPGLVDAYTKIRALYPEFEVILVNRDRSPAEMFAYIRDDRMPWPALAWNSIRGSALNRYAGDGIPCLVLVDENGKVLSDSYRRGRYVGPDAVLEDTWKILRDYRRTHPRPKA